LPGADAVRGLKGLRAPGWAAWACAAALLAPGSSAGQAASPGAAPVLELRLYAPGTPPPEFSGRTLAGGTVSLSGLRGKVVLLNFWASWCVECRGEMPGFDRLHRRLAPRGLAVLGINSREGAETVRRYAAELGLALPLVLDPDGRIGRRYGVIALPTTFLVGRDGQAHGLAIGPREWDGAAAERVIGTLLAEPAPPPARP
jgi:peroxiredoxin